MKETSAPIRSIWPTGYERRNSGKSSSVAADADDAT